MLPGVNDEQGGRGHEQGRFGGVLRFGVILFTVHLHFPKLYFHHCSRRHSPPSLYAPLSWLVWCLVNGFGAWTDILVVVGLPT